MKFKYSLMGLLFLVCSVGFTLASPVGGKGVKKEVFASLDMLNIMAYDGRYHVYITWHAFNSCVS